MAWAGKPKAGGLSAATRLRRRRREIPFGKIGRRRPPVEKPPGEFFPRPGFQSDTRAGALYPQRERASVAGLAEVADRFGLSLRQMENELRSKKGRRLSR